MSAGGITKWDRKSNSLMRWKVPVLRSSPYGVIIDSRDKVWFADHYVEKAVSWMLDPAHERCRRIRLAERKRTENHQKIDPVSDPVWHLGMQIKNGNVRALWVDRYSYEYEKRFDVVRTDNAVGFGEE